MLREADDELRFHFAMRVAELQALGMDESAAEAEALRRFGDTTEYQAYVARRAARTVFWHRVVEWLAAYRQDAQFAMRQWRKAPGFTATALLTLALGIGANTAIFSVVHRLLLAPLPYPNGHRIVIPMAQDGQGDLASIDSTLLKEWHARSRSIDDIAGADEETFSLRPDGSVDSIAYAGITSNFLHVLGVRPLLGRTFTLEEERSGAAVAMISSGFWQRAYGGRSTVLGSSIQFRGKPYEIVGVTPPDLALPMASEWARTRPAVSLPSPDLWMPETLARASDFGFPAPSAFATLRPGVSADIASRELQSIASQMPDAAQRHSRVRAMRAQDFLDAREARAVRVLFVAVGALLLIACANVANLLLARAWARRREFAVRLSLGAGRGRLARQALAESLLLALAGGVLGIGVASQTLRLIIALRPVSLDHLADVRLEPQVLLWALSVSIATGLLFGCAPAFFMGGASNDVLRSETPTGSGSHASRRARSILIVFEIAVSLALLVSAGLLVRSFRDLQQMPMGFEPRGLVSVDMLMGARPRDSRLAIRNEIVDRLRALPGVTGVTIGMLPGKGFLGAGVESENGSRAAATVVRSVGTSFIGPDYFGVARIPLIEGRVPDSLSLDASWKAGRSAALSPEVVVNRALARRLWPNGHAIGHECARRRTRAVSRRLRRGRPSSGLPKTFTWPVFTTIPEHYRSTR